MCPAPAWARVGAEGATLQARVFAAAALFLLDALGVGRTPAKCVQLPVLKCTEVFLHPVHCPNPPAHLLLLMGNTYYG